MRFDSPRVAVLAMAGLGICLLAGCGAKHAPETKEDMKKSAFGTPPPPDVQAKLNAQGAAIAANQAQAQANAAQHPNATPPPVQPAGTSH